MVLKTKFFKEQPNTSCARILLASTGSHWNRIQWQQWWRASVAIWGTGRTTIGHGHPVPAAAIDDAHHEDEEEDLGTWLRLNCWLKLNLRVGMSARPSIWPPLLLTLLSRMEICFWRFSWFLNCFGPNRLIKHQVWTWKPDNPCKPTHQFGLDWVGWLPGFNPTREQG